jgi:hypothetical protein
MRPVQSTLSQLRCLDVSMISIFVDGKVIASSKHIDPVTIAQNFHRFRNHNLAHWISQVVPPKALQYIHKIEGNKNIFEKILGFSSWISCLICERDKLGKAIKSSRVKIDVGRNVDIRIVNDAHQSTFDSSSTETDVAEKVDEKYLDSGTTIVVDGRIVCQFPGHFVSGIYMFFFNRPGSVHMIFQKLSTTDVIGDCKDIVVNAREMRVLIRE